MTTKTSLLLGAAATLALLAPAHAAQSNGWYVGLEGGASWMKDLDFYEQATSLSVVTHFHHYMSDDTPVGWALLATAGYDFGHFRAELEAGYRDNKVKHYTSHYVTLNGAENATTFTNTRSDAVKEFSLMANVLYDITVADRVSLSLGAGAGADHIKFDIAPTDPENIDSDGWSFAYQGIAGLSYDLTSRTQLVLNYRYLRATDPKMVIDVSGSHTCCVRVDDIATHTATVGLRYSFGAAEPVAAPPPPPPPPPTLPPPPPKQFTIFFGYNKCNITAEADRVLGEAAAAAKSGNAASVRIVGHTDSSGSNAYNQRLSECRAGAAKTNLTAKGIAEGSIATVGRGESELMVQTGDGVKEPQNRRATIDVD